MSRAQGTKTGGAWGAYRDAGVDIDAGERAVELMRASVDATRRPEVIGGLGGFASAMALPAGMREPILVSSTDGVGTKIAIAMALSRYDTVGHDLVAMCADDLVCAGAEPLFFLDYIAVGHVFLGWMFKRFGLYHPHTSGHDNPPAGNGPTYRK